MENTIRKLNMEEANGFACNTDQCPNGAIYGKIGHNGEGLKDIRCKDCAENIQWIKKPILNNRIKKGTGIFTCVECKKSTRKTGQDSDELCEQCEDRLQHENSHADNNYPNDECDFSECPVKHYTPEQRWWNK